MSKLILSAAISAAALLTTSATAQSFTYEVTWQPVESIGGMTGSDGPQYSGGVVDGTYVTSYATGESSTGSVRCVGMDQPDGGIFAIHLACTTTEESGSGSLVYGCNFLGEPGPETPLGCVGGVEGKSGQFANRRGSLTMEWYSAGQSRGTGQWYGN